jgi:hypothetical protein
MTTKEKEISNLSILRKSDYERLGRGVVNEAGLTEASLLIWNLAKFLPVEILPSLLPE